MSVTPPLMGPAHARRCTRWLGVNDDGSEWVCEHDPVAHIAWSVDDEGMDAGFVCAEHLLEIGTKWAAIGQHPVGPCCGMPGAVWVEGEQRCRYEDGLPVAEPTRAVAEQVPA